MKKLILASLIVCFSNFAFSQEGTTAVDKNEDVQGSIAPATPTQQESVKAPTGQHKKNKKHAGKKKKHKKKSKKHSA